MKRTPTVNVTSQPLISFHIILPLYQPPRAGGIFSASAVELLEVDAVCVLPLNPTDPGRKKPFLSGLGLSAC